MLKKTRYASYKLKLLKYTLETECFMAVVSELDERNNESRRRARIFREAKANAKI